MEQLPDDPNKVIDFSKARQRKQQRTLGGASKKKGPPLRQMGQKWLLWAKFLVFLFLLAYVLDQCGW